MDKSNNMARIKKNKKKTPQIQVWSKNIWKMCKWVFRSFSSSFPVVMRKWFCALDITCFVLSRSNNIQNTIHKLEWSSPMANLSEIWWRPTCSFMRRQDAEFTTIDGKLLKTLLTANHLAWATDKSVAYLNRAVIDILAKPAVAELNGWSYVISLSCLLTCPRAAMMGSHQ